MDKLKLAHDWAIELLRAGDSSDDIVSCAWRYADAMQAEADERNKAEAAQKRKEMREMLNADNTFVEREGQHFDGVEEWQPDWSQSPRKMNWFSVDKDGTAVWHLNKPTISATEWVIDCSDCGGDCYMYTSNFGYTGNWQDSLRERPKALCEVDWRVAPCWAKEWVMRYGSAKWECGTSSNSWEHAPSFGFTGSHVVERPHGF